MVMWSKLMLRLILWDVYIKGVLQLFEMNALSFAQSINIILVGVWQPCWSFVYRDHSAPANNASSSLFTMHSSLVLVAASIAAHSHSLEWDIAVVNSKASIKHSERCMDKECHWSTAYPSADWWGARSQAPTDLLLLAYPKDEQSVLNNRITSLIM